MGIIEQIGEAVKAVANPAEAINNAKEQVTDKIKDEAKELSDSAFKGALDKLGLSSFMESILKFFGAEGVFSFLGLGNNDKDTDSKDSSSEIPTESRSSIIDKIGETFKEYALKGKVTNWQRMKVRTDEQMKKLLEAANITSFHPPVETADGKAIKPYENWAQARSQGHAHEGVDYPAPVGSPVSAAFEGKVVHAGSDGGAFGNLVILQKGDVTTYYAHLSKIDVQVGDTLKAGESIGKSGNTGRSSGPHLHFEIRYGAEARLNPLQVAHVCSADHSHA